MEFDMRDIPTRQMMQELADKVPELDAASTETMLLFMRTASNLFKYIYEGLAAHGLSHGKLRVLITMYTSSHKMFTPSEIAEQQGISRPTVTGLLDGLERDGIVERISHSNDRRMVMVRLTDSGTEMLQKVLPEIFLKVSRLMSEFDEQDRQTLIALLDKFTFDTDQA